jgi:hypothetical protein
MDTPTPIDEYITGVYDLVIVRTWGFAGRLGWEARNP